MSNTVAGPVSIEDDPSWAVFGYHQDLGLGIIGWFGDEFSAYWHRREWSKTDPLAKLDVVRVNDPDSFSRVAMDFVSDYMPDLFGDEPLGSFLPPEDELDIMGYPYAPIEEEAQVIQLDQFR